MELKDFNLKSSSDDYTDGLIDLPWYDSSVEVRVYFERENDENPSPKQIQAFKYFLEDKSNIFQKLEDQLLEYYKKVRAEASEYYEDKYFNETFPLINNKKDLSTYMKFKTVLISYYDGDSSSFIGLVIDCTWDIEMGIGVKLIKNKVQNIDVQDIVI